MATPALYSSSRNSKIWPTRPLDLVIPATVAADTLIVAVIGTRSADPFGVTNLPSNSFEPGVIDNQNNIYTLATSLTLMDALSSAPSYPSTSESIPDLSGNFPSIYIYTSSNVTVGTTTVSVYPLHSPAKVTNVALTSNVLTITATNNYTVGQTVYFSSMTTATWLAGQTVTVLTSNGSNFTAAFTHANYASTADVGMALGETFNGKPLLSAIEAVVYDFNGLATSGALIASASQITNATLALAGSIADATTGDLILSVGVMKSGNTFSNATGTTRQNFGNLIGSTDAFGVAWSLEGTNAATITAVALTNNVAQVVGTNNFTVGESVTVAGLTTTALNGTFTITGAVNANVVSAIAYTSLTGNVATVAAPNSLVPGQIVTVAATVNTALNGTFVVATANSSQFTYALTHANIAFSADSGTATLLAQISYAKTNANIAYTTDSGTATIGSFEGVGFSNPLGYRMGVASIAMHHS
jgi:hypothetical protein